MELNFVWNDAFSVGDETLDTQHRQILETINSLFETLETGKERAVSESLLDRLLHYTLTHFQHEEQVLQECGFPDYAQHKSAHDNIWKKTAELGNQSHSVTEHYLLCFLRDWWTIHIQGQDKKYIPYLLQPVSADERN